jgi:hypothetical protein
MQNIVLIAALSACSLWSPRLLTGRAEKVRDKKHHPAALGGDGVTHSSSGVCRKE